MNRDELKKEMAAKYPRLKSIWDIQSARDAAKRKMERCNRLLSVNMDAFFRDNPEISVEESELIEHAVYGWEVEE